MKLLQNLIVLFLGLCGPYLFSQDRPNVILIYADDLGYGDLGCYGATGIKTPHIDRIASEGTQFTQFYVAQSVCTASRAALMTGCYSNRVSMSGALNHTSPVGIHPQEKLLPQLFKSKGYATAIYGKWHLGHHPPFLPTRRGFDEWSGIPYSNDNGPLHPVSPDFPALPWYENESVTELNPDQSLFTRRITEKSIDFIRRHRDEPFFLYIPHIMPHVPIFASSKFQGSSERGIYGDVVQELDWSVGEILRVLKEYQLDEKTIVLFSSDNGPFISYGEHAGSAGPLREGKLTTYEGGVRVPGLARWPGKIPAGRICDEVISTIDLYATLAKIVGAKQSSARRDSLDLSPLLLGREDAEGRKTFWFYAGEELQAIRHGPWKLHLPHRYLTVAGEPGKGGKPSNHGKGNPMSIEQSGIYGIASRHGYRVEQTELALYDMRDDPGEKRDRSKEFPEVVQQLKAIAEQARAELGDTIVESRGSEVRKPGDIRPVVPAGTRMISNRKYADRSTGSLLLDIYLPPKKPTQPIPAVLWIHGGGWVRGAKENCLLTWLPSHDYAVISIDYRLAYVAPWPAPLLDCLEGFRWIEKHAKEYDIDPKKIVVAGGSAGGHLAALVGAHSATTQGDLRLKGVIDFYGPSDLLTMPPNVPGPDKTEQDLAASNGAQLLGGIVKDLPERAREASPLHQITHNAPPFLILHGTQDTLVPLDQSQRLHDQLLSKGCSSTLKILEGAGHGGAAFTSDEIHLWILDFLRKIAPHHD